MRLLQFTISIFLLPFYIYHRVQGKWLRYMINYERRYNKLQEELLEEETNWVQMDFMETPIKIKGE